MKFISLLTVAVIALALLSRPPAIAASDRAETLVNAHDEISERVAAVFSRLYEEESVRWRAEGLLRVCGEPVPPRDQFEAHSLIIAIHAKLFGAGDPETLGRVIAAVSMARWGYVAGYREAMMTAFRGGLSRDVTCQVALDVRDELAEFD